MVHEWAKVWEVLSGDLPMTACIIPLMTTDISDRYMLHVVCRARELPTDG